MKAKRTILALSALFGGVLGWHAPDESDVYWHMALGRAVLRSGSRIVPEPYALGSLGEPTVVPEWLWGVLTFGVHQAGGFTALTWLTMVLGALGGGLVAVWVDSLCGVADPPEESLSSAARLGLTAVGLTMFAARLRARPELLALSLLVLFMLLSRSFFQTKGSAQRKLGVGLFALSVLWSQLHGSAVLTPVIFAFSADVKVVRRGPQRRALLGMLLLLVLGVLSCAHGSEVVQYIIDHGAGDATAHIADMAAATWSSFMPTSGPYSLAMSATVLCWVLALLLAPFRLGDALLALLGLALCMTAIRFASAMTLLGMPLAVAGLRALKQGRAASIGASADSSRVSLVIAALVALGLLGWVANETDRSHPLARVGLPPTAFPLRAARVLSSLPAGTNVHTALLAGGPIGFLGDGKLRVSMDTRIPLHFDEAEYGAYRDAVNSAPALQLYFRRFAIGAAVVRRDGADCLWLSQSMRLVSLDAQYATFLPGQGSSLPGLQACSFDHIAAGCPDPVATRSSVNTLLRQHDDAYAHWLSTVVDLECRNATPQRALQAMPSPRSLPDIRDAVARWRVRALWRSGQMSAALAELNGELTRNDTRAMSVLSELWGPGQPVAELRALHRRGLREVDDAAPARERGKLALLCLVSGDYEGAYVQGLRAAVLGDKPARDVLALVAQHHPREHVRKNTAAWLRILATAP